LGCPDLDGELILDQGLRGPQPGIVQVGSREAHDEPGGCFFQSGPRASSHSQIVYHA
jgi:hypothetical protein